MDGYNIFVEQRLSEISVGREYISLKIRELEAKYAELAMEAMRLSDAPYTSYDSGTD